MAKQLSIFDELRIVENEKKRNPNSKRITQKGKLRPIDYDILEDLKVSAIGFNNRKKAQSIIRFLKAVHGELYNYLDENKHSATIRQSIKRLRLHYGELSIESIDGRNGGYYIRLEEDKKGSNTLNIKAKSIIESDLNVGSPEERVNKFRGYYKFLNELAQKLDIPMQDQMKMKLSGYENETTNYYGNKYEKNKNNKEELNKI